MLSIKHDKTINKIVVLTDDPTIHYFLEKKCSNYQYIPWKKQWGYVDKVHKIYKAAKKSETPDGCFKYILGLGWASFLMSSFKEKMSLDDYNTLQKDVILAENYRTVPFQELRDYQNDDVLFLLKFKVGLMTVNTGYGKPQVIATLTNYAHEVLGKKVLLVCPTSKARDELVKRCKNVFGLEVSDCDKKMNGHLDCIITGGLTNSKKAKDPALLKDFKAIIAQYEWVLVDEVEYTINAGGELLFDSAIGAERFYGFSGSADKTGGECITFATGLSEVVIRNKDLIKYFGPSLIFRMPLNMDIDNIIVKTHALDTLKLDKTAIEKSGNIYQEIMNQIWTDTGVCNTIVRIIQHFPMLFIPINNLNYIIDYWMNMYFIGNFRTLLISSKGYQYYDLQGNMTQLTLDEVCEYAKQGLIDVIPGTASSYRALDIPKLENMLLIQGIVAGIVLQSIGRIARGKHMNVISVAPHSGRKIPVYSKGQEERDEMLKKYYQYCNITDSAIEDINL